MLCGDFDHTVDEKNRIKIPAAIREELGVKTYMMKAPDDSTKCIYLYSEEGWQNVCNQLDNMGIYNEDTRRIARKVLSGVVRGEVDKGGRLTLNSGLMDYAFIEDEVHIYGGVSHVEIWAAEEWKKEQIRLEAQSTASLNIKF